MGLQVGINAAMAKKQMEVMDAQKENINADTANKQAENPNIGKEGANLDTQNQIMELDRQLKDLEKQKQTESVKDQIAAIEAQKNKLVAEAKQAEVGAEVATETKAFTIAAKKASDNKAKKDTEAGTTPKNNPYIGSNFGNYWKDKLGGGK